MKGGNDDKAAEVRRINTDLGSIDEGVAGQAEAVIATPAARVTRWGPDQWSCPRRVAGLNQTVEDLSDRCPDPPAAGRPDRTDLSLIGRDNEVRLFGDL